MSPSKKSKSTKKKSKRAPKKHHGPKVKKAAPNQMVDVNRLEFHRHGMAWMPGEEDDDPAVIYNIYEDPGRIGMLYCSCRTSWKGTCKHLKVFPNIINSLKKKMGGLDFTATFEENSWHQFAAVMAEGVRQPVTAIKFDHHTYGNDLAVCDNTEKLLVLYHIDDAGRRRLIERFTLEGRNGNAVPRGAALKKLAMMTLRDDERLLEAKGLKTRRQVFEEGFWHRFAYHCYREFEADGVIWHTSVGKEGNFWLNAKDIGGKTLFNVPVPPAKVERVLDTLADMPFMENSPRIGDLHLQTVLAVRLNGDRALEITPQLLRVDRDGKEKYFDPAAQASAQFEDFYFFEDLNLLLKDRRPVKRLPTFIPQLPMTVPRNMVPQFLLDNGRELDSDLYRLDPRIKDLSIITDIDEMEISPESLERDWYWLSVTYGRGRQSVSLAAILAAKQAGERFLVTDGGWVDTQAPAFDVLDEIEPAPSDDSRRVSGEAVGLRRADVLRLKAAGSRPVKLDGDDKAGKQLERLLALAPMTPLPPLSGRISPLRIYQQRGAEWLWFLYENGLGGLLCDDMGLGKTHQIMGLLAALQASGTLEKTALVVCPTSVLFHWQQKITDHAPGLTVEIHHGSQRNWNDDPSKAQIVVTSYGVLRQDIEMISKSSFSTAVFDEIQHIKNPATLSYKAARKIAADLRVGLTGTPVENSVGDLKALMDVVVPGYLGSNHRFENYYRVPIEQHNDTHRRRQLREVISPFTLRRLKQNVLTDLPPKIEDYRVCRLSEEQTALYREAIGAKGRTLSETLSEPQSKIPYIHIFALLNLLKQICNHPALVTGDASVYGEHESGKWDLFTELLSECLDSGQKVVIYSQYLTMIEIITRHLTESEIEFATLTGSSRQRGKIIARFNQDPDCRVFVGSLKAGGVGIDLVAASVVIHYDRWWNAAKEDQATDRVHRIGQTRGVQVFKLVTQGTLEEKIDAVIAKKRHLMKQVVKEDDPQLVKTFTREELMALLAMPGDLSR